MKALLWSEIMTFTCTLLMQQLSLRVFWLKILCRGFDLGTCSSIKVRKHFPMLVLTLWLHAKIEPGDVSRPILAVFGLWSRCR